MASKIEPVSDSVPKINNEVAVGEDLEFQYRWWRFERGVWILFGILVIMDLLGVFGRGPVAKATAEAPDGSMKVNYERIERFSTPSILTVNFGDRVIHNGKVMLWVSESVVKDLGNQRIVPQPLDSKVGDSGVLYTFSADKTPASVEFALSPSGPGMSHIKLRIPDCNELNLTVVTMP